MILNETTMVAYDVKLSLRGDKRFYTRKEARKAQAEEQARLRRQGFDSLVDGVTITRVECRYASEHLYTDVHAYEIVRIVSDQTIEVRRMDAKITNAEELKFHVGGFAAHCSNQRAQEHAYTSNPDAGVVRIRKNKRGEWVHKGGRFTLQAEPYEFHDFNF